MKIEYNPITGMLEGKAPSYEFPNSIEEAILFTDMNAGACVALIEYSAFQLNSNYNVDLVTRQKPIIDGIVLSNGRSGESIRVASLKQFQYSFQDPILADNTLKSNLYLSKSGYLTLNEPSVLNGDRWFVYIGRRVNDYSFIFDPQEPLDLLNPGGITPPSPLPDPTLDKIVLGETMDSLTCFKIGANGEAFKVKANDINYPFIDGMTLESGVIGQLVKIGRIKNQLYTTSFLFSTSEIYLLGNAGTIVTTRDIGSNYSAIIGRSIANTNNFIFDPQVPIKL